MKNRLSFVDEVALAKEFATDDVVRKSTLRDTHLSPYAGRVLYSDHQTGKVMVQWPWGPEYEQPSELIRDASELIKPPLLLDQLPKTVERVQHQNSDDDFKLLEKYRKSLGADLVNRISSIYDYNNKIDRISKLYELYTKPIKIAVCKSFHLGHDSISTFKVVSSDLSDQFGTEPIRITISNFYGLANKLAIYWKDNGRRYKVTQNERATGKLKCPRCGASPLTPRTYRQGKRILNCKSCGFAISPEDLV